MTTGAKVDVKQQQQYDVTRMVNRLHGENFQYKGTVRRVPEGDMKAFLFDKPEWPVGTSMWLYSECLAYSRCRDRDDLPLIKILCRRMFTMDASVQDGDGWTVFQKAVCFLEGANPVCEALLSMADEFPNHIDFNRKDPWGYTPLFYAVKSVNMTLISACVQRCEPSVLSAPLDAETMSRHVVTDFSLAMFKNHAPFYTGRPLEHLAFLMWRGNTSRSGLALDVLLGAAHEDGSRLDLLSYDHTRCFRVPATKFGPSSEVLQRLGDKVAAATEKQRRYRADLRPTIQSALDVSVGYFALSLSGIVAAYLLF